MVTSSPSVRATTADCSGGCVIRQVFLGLPRDLCASPIALYYTGRHSPLPRTCAHISAFAPSLGRARAYFPLP